jgi:hypothetical protein
VRTHGTFLLCQGTGLKVESTHANGGRARERLETLYDGLNKLEWYVGIFAENYPDYAMTGGLMTTMVAYDAFRRGRDRRCVMDRSVIRCASVGIA